MVSNPRIQSGPRDMKRAAERRSSYISEDIEPKVALPPEISTSISLLLLSQNQRLPLQER